MIVRAIFDRLGLLLLPTASQCQMRPGDVGMGTIGMGYKRSLSSSLQSGVGFSIGMHRAFVVWFMVLLVAMSHVSATSRTTHVERLYFHEPNEEQAPHRPALQTSLSYVLA